MSYFYKSALTVNLAFGWVNYFGLFTLFFILCFIFESYFLSLILTLISPFFNMFWGYISFGYLFVDPEIIEYIQVFESCPFSHPDYFSLLFLC